MATEPVIITSTKTPNILQITLNRPQQLNALNRETIESLETILKDAKTNRSIRGILLTGNGKGFCAGADITQLAPLDKKSGLAFAEYGQHVFSQLETLGKPSIAAIHGFAFGGGCELAMSATLRLAAEGTVFGQPEIKLGVIPGFGGTQRLTRLIGPGRALELCLTGKRFSASDALQWGFLNAITPADQLEAKALALLQECIAYSPIPTRAIIETIYASEGASLTEGLALEAKAFAACCDTKDKQEGVSAFLEKRQPNFCGE